MTINWLLQCCGIGVTDTEEHVLGYIQKGYKLSTKQQSICFLYIHSGGSSGITAAKWPP